MGLESVLSTDFAKAFLLAVFISLLTWFYFLRKKKISIRKNIMKAFVIWTISISISVTFIFAVVPSFCYLLCGHWETTTWVVLVDYQSRFFTFIGSMFLLIVAIEMPLIHKLEKKNSLFIISIGTIFLFLGFTLLPFGKTFLFAAFTVIVWTIGEILIFPFIVKETIKFKK